MGVLQNVSRKILESMYCGTCDVIVRTKTADPITKKTGFTESTVILNQPCRLSYNSAPVTGDGNTASVTQEIKLFLAPEVQVPSGSKIEVTQRGQTMAYSNSSEPKIYDSHQELTLELFERWS